MPFSFDQAERIVRDYVCAQCYHKLYIHGFAEGRMSVVHCPDHGDVEHESVGRVTLYWAEQQGQQNISDLRDVRKNLPDLFPNPNAGKTDRDLLNELGF